jgi:hypothetical protein
MHDLSDAVFSDFQSHQTDILEAPFFRYSYVAKPPVLDQF